jgi:hypothetical protein
VTTPIDSHRAEAAARAAQPSGDVPPALELRGISKRFIGAPATVLEDFPRLFRRERDAADLVRSVVADYC